MYGFALTSPELCAISDFCFHQFIELDGSYIINVRNLGSSLKNFPLGGAKRFDRRYVR